jgi:hypothetical protein
MSKPEIVMVELLKNIREQLDSLLKYVGNISTEIERIREKLT